MGIVKNGWRQLYERHYAFTLRLAFRYLGNYAEAQRAVQKAWKYFFKKYSPDNAKMWTTTFRSYLQRILVEILVNDWLESGDESPPNVAATESMSGIWDPPADSAERAEAEWYQCLILQLVALPSCLRLIFNLCVIDGYSTAEAAVLLDTEAARIDTLVSLARSVLREKIRNL